ncbi:MAG: tetratricopeptide repeat protein [Spirochaetes bacterium]|nr:tetratricopeptide repeat protein [Spirochaetota bacterium]
MRLLAVITAGAVMVSTALHPQTADEYEQCLARYRKGMTNEALLDMRRLLARYPSGPYAADIAFILADAEKEYLPALTLWQAHYDTYTGYKKRDDVLYRIGAINYLHGKFPAAERAFIELRSTYSNSSRYYDASFKLGAIYLSRGSYDDARTLYASITNRFAAAKNDRYYEALIGIAHSYYDQERYPQAIECYREAVRKEDAVQDRAFAAYRLGMCYENTGDNERAKARYAIVCELWGSSYAATLARQRLKQLSAGTPAVTTNAATTVPTPVQKAIPPVIHGAAAAVNTAGQVIYQTGLFQSDDAAKRQCDALKALGCTAFVVRETKDDVTMYKVRIAVPDKPDTLNATKEMLSRENILFFKIKTP